MVEAIIPAMGSDVEQQMKLCSLVCHSPPTVWPSF